VGRIKEKLKVGKKPKIMTSAAVTVNKTLNKTNSGFKKAAQNDDDDNTDDDE